jgi:hypothetical protein
MGPIYPAVAEELLSRCQEYRTHRRELESLKQDIWSAAAQISVPQERFIRDFLQRAEARLDIVQFTVDESQVRSASMEIVDEVETQLTAYLAGEEADS